jgi:hypothetical protein
MTPMTMQLRYRGATEPASPAGPMTADYDNAGAVACGNSVEMFERTAPTCDVLDNVDVEPLSGGGGRLLDDAPGCLMKLDVRVPVRRVANLHVRQDER